MKTAVRLDPRRVSAIFHECTLRDDEKCKNPISAAGISPTPIQFHPDRIEKHKEEIQAMLGELPEQFRKSVGGGWSFLQGCQNKHGELWTGMQMIVEQLFLLGMAIGKVRFMLPRKMWARLPGGMPYYIIDM